MLNLSFTPIRGYPKSLEIVSGFAYISTCGVVTPKMEYGLIVNYFKNKIAISNGYAWFLGNFKHNDSEFIKTIEPGKRFKLSCGCRGIKLFPSDLEELSNIEFLPVDVRYLNKG